MRDYFTRGFGVLACASMLGVPAGAHAGNRLQVLQTASSPCDTDGGGNAIAVSPGGDHLYELGANRLTVSSRDAGTGQLTPLQTVPFQGGPGDDMSVSADGRHLYLLRISPPGLVLFERDAGSGTISLVETGIQAATYPRGFEMSPDGAHVYLAAYSGDVQVLARNATTGALTNAGVLNRSFSAMAVSPDGAYLYAYESSRRVVTLRRDAVTGMLTPLDSIGFSLADNTAQLAVSGDGTSVYLAGLSGLQGRIVAFARDVGTGLLTQTDVEHIDAPLIEAIRLAMAPDDAQVYVGTSRWLPSSFGGEGLFVFDRSDTDGSLSLQEQHLDQADGVDGLGWVSGIVVPPDGAHVYTIGEGTVTFGRAAATGALTFLDNAERDGTRGLSLVASPDGKHLYRLCGHTIVRLDRDASTGLLTPAGSIDLGSLLIDYGRRLWMAPDGEHVYVSDSYQDKFAILDRDPASGALENGVSHAASGLGLWSLNAMAFSPDGKHAYSIRWSYDGVGALARDVVTGALSGPGTYLGGPALDWAEDIVVSPDGGHVYVGTHNPSGANPMGDGISAFSRDPATGTLTFATAQTVNGGGGGSLGGVLRLAPSADGRLLYASGVLVDDESEAGGVVAYARNPSGGGIVARSTLREGTTAAGTLDSPSGMAVAPDGARLYALHGAGVHVMRSDPDTGALGFVETVPVDVSSATSHLVSPDGRQLYVLLASGDVMVLGDRPVCGATPAIGCVGAASSTLKIATKIGPADSVVWKWKALGTIAAGDPLMTTEYALCVYDGSWAAQPVLSSSVLAGRSCGTKPCWAAAATGYKYADRAGIPDGIATIRIATGVSGDASITLKGKGASLPPLHLPYATPLIVQLQGSNGECWDATYAAVTSDARRLKAKQ